jgi:adenylate kinase
MGEGIAASLVAQLLQLLGPGMVAVALVTIMAYLWTRQLRDKTEKDRAEHTKKWDSMVQQQREAVQAMAVANETNVNRIMKAQAEEIDRLFQLHERKADALDLQARMLTVLVQKIDSNQWCPMIRRKDGPT